MKARKQKVTSGKAIKRNELIAQSIAYYRRCPDKFCEEILEIKLNLYQKVLIRAFFKKKYSAWVLSRGLGKTWLGALALVVYGMLYRNTLIGVIAPSFRQSKILVEDKIIKDLMDRSPFLKSEIKRVIVNMAEARIEFYNGSRIMAVPTGDGNKIRGYRFHVLMCDEYAQIKKEILDLVVNPMMNVKRGYEVGKTEYDDDIGNRLLITSSAYFRHNHLYATFKQYVDEMASGNDKYFVCALSYKVGLQVGLFDSDHIEKEKKRLSPVDFRMEYECIFPNMSENAWIEPKDLEECSVLKHIEISGDKKFEYIMSLDVARVEGGDNTILHVFKLLWRKSHLEKHLIYTLSMNGEKFEAQASNIRQVLKRFPNTIRIYMDTQTIGQGLADELSKEYWDFEDLKSYPPLIDVNDEQAVKNIKGGVPLIFGISPTPEHNHRMGMAVKKDTQKRHLKMYSLDAGEENVKKGDEVQTVLAELSEEEEKQVMEAEATRREVLGIEAKPQGMYFKFEAATKRGRKDRWSALGLGLYGAELIETERNEDDDVILVGSVASR
ncbi:terminase large subunit domain-containing protein [Paenibacillus sp. MMO-177]|uniref:terminase large subunit domain-containing protein n=1 Tax=Paenibacillus sp. MMO-177 TaxID=3081289 RepID=UPI003017052B